MVKKPTEISFPTIQSDQDRRSLMQALSEVDGVIVVNEDRPAQKLRVTYDSRRVDTFGLAAAVSATGHQLPVVTYKLHVGGMTCAACAFHVESALTDVPGVIDAQVDLTSDCATITVISSVVKPGAWHQALAATGYEIVTTPTRIV